MARPRAMRWRYNSHGAQEIEMEADEYAEQKIMALRKMKRRILFLSILYALVSCFLFILGLVVSSTYDRSTKFQKPTFGMSLNQLYYIVSILSFISCTLGFYVYCNWKRMKRDGFKLVFVTRIFLFVAGITWLSALWYTISILQSIGIVNFNTVFSNASVFILSFSLVLGFIMVLVPAPILRTISRKTTTADELFGAEFLTEFEYERRNSVMEDTALPEQIRKALPSAPELEMSDAVALTISDQVDFGEAIPYAQSLFQLDINAPITGYDFLKEWNDRPASGSFSFTFTNSPTLAQVQMHLQTNGFIVHVASKASNVLEVQFTGYHASSETFFYGEFVILVARRYFQSTFKCDDDGKVSDFIGLFQLQHLFVIED